MEGTRASGYEAKLGRVFDYIDEHLGEDLSVEVLSRVANFSKYHFHRRFSAYTGTGVYGYVRLLRLRRASYRLAFKPLERILDIALEAGFENPESFSRAFRLMFGQTPSQFRRRPAWRTWNARYRFHPRGRKQNMEVRIVDFPETRIAVLEHRGPPDLVNDSVAKFIEWRKASGLSPVKTSRTFGIVYDNPETTPPEEFRFDIAGAVLGEVPANPQGVVAKSIACGRCAVARHAGPHYRIGETVYYLYRDWLPQSGECLRDFPLYFHYLNLLPDTPEHELQADVYLPLK